MISEHLYVLIIKNVGDFSDSIIRACIYSHLVFLRDKTVND